MLKSIQTENIQFAHLELSIMLFCIFKFCLISNYSNSVLYCVFCFFRLIHTAQEKKFSITDFFSKSDQISRKLRTRSNLLKKSVMEDFIVCAVPVCASA